MVKFACERLNGLGNVKLLTEVCIPYLYFHSEMIKPKETKFKNSPPIRVKQEKDLLLQGVKEENLVDIVSSSHIYIAPEYKIIDKGNFRKSFDGLSCIGFNLQVLWTKLYIREKKKPIEIEEKEKQFNNLFKIIIKKMCVNPAKILGLENKKGSIKKGAHADLVVWNPFKIIKIEPQKIVLNSPKLFLFRKKRMYGEVTHTFLRGKLVYKLGDPSLLKEKNGKIIRKKY